MKKKSPVSRSGRFASGPAADVAQFTESISFDWRLWRHDILGSMAHAEMLHKIGVLTKNELRAIIRGLNDIGKEIHAGKFKWKPELEDVHMNIEAELTRRVPAGAKLHTARSRNDQVALDMRLWLRDEIILLLGEIADLQRALVSLGEKNADVHHSRLHASATRAARLSRAPSARLRRDARTRLRAALGLPLARERLPARQRRDCRFHACRWIANSSPSCSASWTPTAKSQLTQNSMDAVSDRDFAVEFCAAGALLAVHLSRLAEDVILWASAEFNFIKIADAYTTGSSLMPQKKNPDIAELARGKTGRVFGNLMCAAHAAERLADDLQPRFAGGQGTAVRHRRHRARHHAAHGRDVAQHEGQRAACAAAASDPALLATDLADYLVKKGMPFRQAHHVVGAVVALAEKTGKPLNQLTLAELQTM